MIQKLWHKEQLTGRLIFDKEPTVNLRAMSEAARHLVEHRVPCKEKCILRSFCADHEDCDEHAVNDIGMVCPWLPMIATFGNDNRTFCGSYMYGDELYTREEHDKATSVKV